MDRALYSLAEAVRGQAAETRWTLDENIYYRETKRLFERLSLRQITASQALEIFQINGRAKLKQLLSVVEERYSLFLVHLTEDEQKEIPSLKDLEAFCREELPSIEYSTNPDVVRKTLRPMFEMCYDGHLSARDAQDAVMDYTSAQRELILTVGTGLVQDLVRQLYQTGIAARVLQREDKIADGDSDPHEPQNQDR